MLYKLLGISLLLIEEKKNIFRDFVILRKRWFEIID